MLDALMIDCFDDREAKESQFKDLTGTKDGRTGGDKAIYCDLFSSCLAPLSDSGSTREKNSSGHFYVDSLGTPRSPSSMT